IEDLAANAIAGGFVSGQTYTIDHTAPSVSSIDIVGASPNNATSEQFTVTFSEAVSGGDETDFTLTDTNTVSCTITTVSAGGSSYTVTADNVTGHDTLPLPTRRSSDLIEDLAANAIAGGFASGQTYTIDHTAPTVSSIDIVGASPNNATSEQFTVTF